MTSVAAGEILLETDYINVWVLDQDGDAKDFFSFKISFKRFCGFFGSINNSTYSYRPPEDNFFSGTAVQGGLLFT